jgi:hypothetical protein
MEKPKENDTFVIENKEGIELDSELNMLVKLEKKKLKMEGCVIKATQQFQNEVTKLEELTLISCEIKDKALKDLNFPKLVKLTINDCKLTLDEIANLSAHELQELDLKTNSILKIEHDFRFNKMPKLRSLDLCNC